jgi:hypothetical protein
MKCLQQTTEQLHVFPIKVYSQFAHFVKFYNVMFLVTDAALYIKKTAELSYPKLSRVMYVYSARLARCL